MLIFIKEWGVAPYHVAYLCWKTKKTFYFFQKKTDPLTLTHQLAEEFSFESPSDYTLETSRPGGAPIAALTALHTLRQNGYQLYLGRLIELVGLFKKLIQKIPDIIVINPHSLGYVTMIAIIPPGLNQNFKNLPNKKKLLYLKDNATPEMITQINSYMKAFFRWDNETRMNQCLETVYSYSSSYIKAICGTKISALKFYPVSPHLNESYIKKSVKILKTQKTAFDKNIWLKNVNK